MDKVTDFELSVLLAARQMTNKAFPTSMSGMAIEKALAELIERRKAGASIQPLALPTYDECRVAVHGGFANPLQNFVYNNEPGVGVEDFRATMAELIEFVRRAQP